MTLPTASLDSQSATALAALKEGVEAVTTSDGWQRWLEVQAAFPRYSPRNSLLIAMQCPAASLVCSARQWNQLGRRVNAGERSLRILAPLHRTMEVASVTSTADQSSDPEARKLLVGFRPVPVFDVSQTNGQPLPASPVHQLDGDEVPSGLRAALDSATSQNAIEVRRGSASELGIPSSANGAAWMESGRRVIGLRSGLSLAQEAKTMAHEVGHHLLGHLDTERRLDGTTRADLEVEAESFAFLVCRSHGLATDDYSFGYVAAWAGGDSKKVFEVAHRVTTAARPLCHDAQAVLRRDRDSEAEQCVGR